MGWFDCVVGLGDIYIRHSLNLHNLLFLNEMFLVFQGPVRSGYVTFLALTKTLTISDSSTLKLNQTDSDKIH